MEMNKLSLEDFSNICRTCLHTKNDFSPIFESKAAEMLNYCDFYVVSENDQYPKNICYTCIQILEQSYRFKQQCENSYSILVKLLSKKQDQEYVYRTIYNNEETSIDSNDLTTKNDEDISQTNTQDHLGDLNIEDKNEDLISFLDKPLPPPLPHCCLKCDQSFSEENDLKIHQSVHNSELTCLACSKKFTNRQILKRHLKIHLIRKPHVCKICSKSFAESYALTKHLRRHSGVPREKRHFCPECGQGFSEPYYLKVHLRKHTGERPLLCTDCNKAFADPRSFKIHIMIHSGEKPHKCNFCMKTFIQRANLTKHLRIHTGEKPYICKICKKKFSQSSSLDKHLRIHTGQKLYLSDRCNRRYSEKNSLLNHQKIHTTCDNRDHLNEASGGPLDLNKEFL